MQLVHAASRSKTAYRHQDRLRVQCAMRCLWTHADSACSQAKSQVPNRPGPKMAQTGLHAAGNDREAIILLASAGSKVAPLQDNRWCSCSLGRSLTQPLARVSKLDCRNASFSEPRLLPFLNQVTAVSADAASSWPAW